MKHAEVIYETGAHSIMSVDDEDEFRGGLLEQHKRAVNGEPGSAQDWEERYDVTEDQKRAAFAIASRPAERVKRIIMYDRHPADLVPVGNDGSQPVDANAAHELLDGMTSSDGTVNTHQLTAALRDEVSPVYPLDQGKHKSMFKMEGTEYSTDFLKAAE